MNSVGLNVFIAVVGLTAGPTFVAGIKEAGFGLFLWGLAATSVPMLLAPLIGKYIFKFDPAINLGGCGAAGPVRRPSQWSPTSPRATSRCSAIRCPMRSATRC